MHKSFLRAYTYVIDLEAYADGIPLTGITNLVIGLRVYALYRRNKYIAVFLVTYIIAELAVLLWIYLTPGISAVTLPGPASVNKIPLLHSCLVSPSSRM